MSRDKSAISEILETTFVFVGIVESPPAFDEAEFFVFCCDEQVKAVLQLKREHDCGKIECLGFEKDFGRESVAEQLIRFVVSAARNEGLQRIVAEKHVRAWDWLTACQFERQPNPDTGEAKFELSFSNEPVECRPQGR